MQIINIHKAKTHLSRLLNDVLQGKEVVIGKAGNPIVKLVAFKKPFNKRLGGQLRGKINLANDFEELPDDFLGYFSK